MAAILIDIQPGDEVIMASYTFTSTANAFVMRGAKIVFIDIRPDTMNIDENLIEQAINKKTKAIVVMHYAGVACEMDKIKKIADAYKIFLIEDAAQGVMSKYKDKFLGTIGDIGAYSFHETKNYSSGEGGAILLNDTKFIERSEILREKGTNRSKFFRGQVDKYTWVDMGSSYLPSDINAAYLYAQLEKADVINNDRLESWGFYNSQLLSLSNNGLIQLPFIPEETTHNAHMFYIKTRNIAERSDLIEYLRKNDVFAVFHYIPLHLSPAGQKYGVFNGKDIWTTKESERILRLPMFFGLKSNEKEKIVQTIYDFYKS
ncbi:MAG: dTDP-4-amino-4,6-dideoxygalactose transaminase [Spirochaetes bacterium RIFOXYB1_FULL_32_8]|nr:MAG: dTDP-4-amino-4,6-dideoxygalactose transaminase [Spirochaetes bacterium RIFOXYB1_FULL_32_8]